MKNEPRKTIWAIRIPERKAARAKEYLTALLILMVFFGALGLALFDRYASCQLYAPKLPFKICLAQGKWKQEHIEP